MRRQINIIGFGISFIFLIGSMANLSCKKPVTEQKTYPPNNETQLWTTPIADFDLACFLNNDTITFRSGNSQESSSQKAIVMGLNKSAVQRPTLLPFNGGCNFLEAEPQFFIKLSESLILAAFSQEWKSRVSLIAVKVGDGQGGQTIEISKVFNIRNELVPVDISTYNILVHNEPLFDETGDQRNYLVRQFQLDGEKLEFETTQKGMQIDESEIDEPDAYRKLLGYFCRTLERS